jgi:hypothetical protein
VVPIVEFLILAAEASAKAARAAYRKRTRRPRGGTLRPGPETPLWNELVVAAREQLSGYGAQARLARVLRVPRQRVHQYLRATTACPDAERALLLLVWVQARRNVRDLL